LNDLVKEHLVNNKRVTLTAVQPEGRFGSLDIDNNSVKNFIEKPIGDGGWVNGGFFVINPNGIKEIISGDETVWEDQPLKQLAKEGELGCYKHSGFWKPMDTLRDKVQLEELWSSNNAPWAYKK
jgi:glucose-1-phosphate cytidylyltransferase